MSRTVKLALFCLAIVVGSSNGLRTAPVNSADGKPTIIQVNHHWDSLKAERFVGMTISGTNLGSRPGKVRVFLVFSKSGPYKDWLRSNPFEIDTQSVKDWKSEKIDLAFTNAMQEKFNSIWSDMSKKLSGQFPDFGRGIEVQVQTPNGTVSAFSYQRVLEQAKPPERW